MTAPRPIPLSATWFGDAELDRVREALAGRVAGDGPFCRRVEKRLRDRLGAHVLLTTSGTHAMELALLALGVGPGHEVICPSFTFVSTANAVLRVGAVPVLADIEPTYLGLDAGAAEKLVTARTRAILPVHYGGIAAEMEPLLAFARDRGLLVVEDAAQGFDAAWRGRPLGTLGDAGCFSFHETKNVTAGEGGAVTFRDPDAARRAEIIREKGTNRSQFLRGEVDKYTWVDEGSSYILSDVLAAILDAQLDRAEAIQSRRAAVAARYHEALADWAVRAGVTLPPRSPDRAQNGHLFHLLYPSEATRDAALVTLRARGVMASFHYVPLHSSPYGKQFAPVDCPVTTRVASSLVRLPLHPLLTDADVDRVVEAVLST